MAGPNEVMRAGLNAILTKTLSMKEAAPAPILGAELIPAITLEQQRPEWEFLAGSMVAGLFQSETAVAGNQNTVLQIRNPLGSGALAIIERAIASGQAGAAFTGFNSFVSIDNSFFQAQLANAAFWGATDSRMLAGGGGTPRTTFPLLATSNRIPAAPVGGTFIAAYGASMAANGQGVLLDLLAGCGPIILAPGSQVHFWTVPAVNTAVTWAIGARARTLEPSELR